MGHATITQDVWGRCSCLCDRSAATEAKNRSFKTPLHLTSRSLKGKCKDILFNVGSQRKPESLFPAEPTYLPSTQSKLVLLETVHN